MVLRTSKRLGFIPKEMKNKSDIWKAPLRINGEEALAEICLPIRFIILYQPLQA